MLSPNPKMISDMDDKPHAKWIISTYIGFYFERNRGNFMSNGHHWNQEFDIILWTYMRLLLTYFTTFTFPSCLIILIQSLTT